MLVSSLTRKYTDICLHQIIGKSNKQSYTVSIKVQQHQNQTQDYEISPNMKVKVKL